MAVNNLTFNQLSTVLNSIVSQATGTSQITPTNTGEFVSVAQVGLKAGYDPIINAISQVLSRTIFSIRPYTRKFRGLEADGMRYGNIVRKVQSVDKSFENDDRFTLTDGSSVDMYKVNKPEIIQTNFYGANTYQKSLTIFRDQLDNAFSSPDEFSRFITMTMSNISDMIEQAHEATARATIANFIGGIYDNNGDNVIHLLTEYNTLTGQELTATSVYAPENFAPFIRWMYSRINTLAGLMSERSEKFHINLEGKPVMRHTPKDDQRTFIFAPALNQINAQVRSVTFNNDYLNMDETESVNFWQALETPTTVNVTPTYLNSADGTLKTASAAVTVAPIFGLIADRDALGYTVINEWNSPTPFNARGGYSNIYWHFTDRYWNDFMENGVLLLLD